jgi:hypothetical protein
MLLIEYKRHGEDYCFYARDRRGSPLFYPEDVGSIFFLRNVIS